MSSFWLSVWLVIGLICGGLLFEEQGKGVGGEEGYGEFVGLRVAVYAVAQGWVLGGEEVAGEGNLSVVGGEREQAALSQEGSADGCGLDEGGCTARGEYMVHAKCMVEGGTDDGGAAVARGGAVVAELSVEGFGDGGAEDIGEAEFAFHDGVVVRKAHEWLMEGPF